jgi:plastocyanin
MVWFPVFAFSFTPRITFICKTLVMMAFAYATSVSAASAQGTIQIWLADNKGRAIQEAVVMLQSNSGVTIAPRVTRRDLTVQQIDREFVPRVAIAALGARVAFPNRDIVQHSVYSFSKAKSFEIPIYAGDSPQTITLDKAGVVTLGCNIHDWMVGYIVVVDAPIAELTDANGSVTIADLARGRYLVRIWHPQLKTGVITQEVSFDGNTQRIDIKLDLPPTRARYKPPLNVKRY